MIKKMTSDMIIKIMTKTKIMIKQWKIAIQIIKKAKIIMIISISNNGKNGK